MSFLLQLVSSVRNGFSKIYDKAYDAIISFYNKITGKNVKKQTNVREEEGVVEDRNIKKLLEKRRQNEKKEDNEENKKDGENYKENYDKKNNEEKVEEKNEMKEKEEKHEKEDNEENKINENDKEKEKENEKENENENENADDIIENYEGNENNKKGNNVGNNEEKKEYDDLPGKDEVEKEKKEDDLLKKEKVNWFYISYVRGIKTIKFFDTLSGDFYLAVHNFFLNGGEKEISVDPKNEDVKKASDQIERAKKILEGAKAKYGEEVDGEVDADYAERSEKIMNIGLYVLDGKGNLPKNFRDLMEKSKHARILLKKTLALGEDNRTEIVKNVMAYFMLRADVYKLLEILRSALTDDEQNFIKSLDGLCNSVFGCREGLKFSNENNLVKTTLKSFYSIKSIADSWAYGDNFEEVKEEVKEEVAENKMRVYSNGKELKYSITFKYEEREDFLLAIYDFFLKDMGKELKFDSSNENSEKAKAQVERAKKILEKAKAKCEKDIVGEVDNDYAKRAGEIKQKGLKDLAQKEDLLKIFKELMTKSRRARILLKNTIDQTEISKTDIVENVIAYFKLRTDVHDLLDRLKTKLKSIGEGEQTFIKELENLVSDFFDYSKEIQFTEGKKLVIGTLKSCYSIKGVVYSWFQDEYEHNLQKEEECFVCDENQEKCYKLIEEGSKEYPHVSKVISYALIREKMAQAGKDKAFVKFNKDNTGERKSRLEKIVEEGELLRAQKHHILNKISTQYLISKVFKEGDANTYKGILKSYITKKNKELVLKEEEERNLDQALLCIDKLYYLQDEFSKILKDIDEKHFNKEKLEKELIAHISLYAEITVQLKNFALTFNHYGEGVMLAACSQLVKDREVELFGEESEFYKKLFNICSYYRNLDDFSVKEPETTEVFEIVNNNGLKENGYAKENSKVYIELLTKGEDTN